MSEPEQQIDVSNNRESRAYAAGSTSQVSRASDGGAPPRDAPAAGETPEHGTGGTAAGSPVSGLEVDEPADGPATGHS